MTTKPKQEVLIADRLICSFMGATGYGLFQTSQFVKNGERIEARWGKCNGLFKVKKWK